MTIVKPQPKRITKESQRALNEQWNNYRVKSIKKYQAKQRTGQSTKSKSSRKEPSDTLTKKLLPVYRRLLVDWLPHNRRCIANMEGCTMTATECHHQYKRTGWWLIVMELWLPICRSCHRQVTKNSRDAINSGISISRLTNLKYTFNKHVRRTLKLFNIEPPE